MRQDDPSTWGFLQVDGLTLGSPLAMIDGLIITRMALGWFQHGIPANKVSSHPLVLENMERGMAHPQVYTKKPSFAMPLRSTGSAAPVTAPVMRARPHPLCISGVPPNHLPEICRKLLHLVCPTACARSFQCLSQASGWRSSWEAQNQRKSISMSSSHEAFG